MKLGDGLFLLFCGLLLVGAVASLAGDPNVQQLFSGVAPVVDGGGHPRGSPGDTAPVVVVVVEPTTAPLPVRPTAVPAPTAAPPVVPTWVAPTVSRYEYDGGAWAGPTYYDGGYSGDSSTLPGDDNAVTWEGFPTVVVWALGGTAILAGLVLLAVYAHRYVTITRIQAAALQAVVRPAGRPEEEVAVAEAVSAAACAAAGRAEDNGDGEGPEFEAIGLDEFLQPAVAEA